MQSSIPLIDCQKRLQKSQNNVLLPSSPDLNPVENLWAILKHEIYSEGKQYTSLNSISESVVAASATIDREQIKTLNNCMNRQLMKVIEKKGGYTGH